MASPVTKATQKIEEYKQQNQKTPLDFEEEIAKVKRALAEAENLDDEIESRLWSAQRCDTVTYNKVRDEQDANDEKRRELRERLSELESKKPFTVHLPSSQLRQRKK